MTPPRTDFYPISARDMASYFFTRKTGGANRAILAATDEYFYMDVFQDETLAASSLGENRAMAVYNGAKLTIPQAFLNLGDVVVMDTGTLIVSNVLQNDGSLTVRAGGTLILTGSIINRGILALEEGATLVVDGVETLVSQELANGDPADAFPYGKITYSLDLYAWMEDASDPELLETGCSSGPESTVVEGYTLALIRHVTAKSKSEFQALLPPIAFTGYAREATASVDPAAKWVTVGRFKKIRYTVTFSDVLKDNRSLGPNRGTITSRTEQVPFLRSVVGAVQASFTGFTYGGTVFFGGSSIAEATYRARKVKANETVLVEYSPVSYRVEYRLNGGSGASVVYYTPDLGLTLLSPTPPSGRSFSGWYLDQAFTQPVSSVPRWSTGDQVVYAKYVAIVYTVYYELNGGEGIPTSGTYTVDTGIPTLPEPHWGSSLWLKRYFRGWYSDAALTLPVESIPVGSTGNRTLYAKFTRF